MSLRLAPPRLPVTIALAARAVIGALGFGGAFAWLMEASSTPAGALGVVWAAGVAGVLTAAAMTGGDAVAAAPLLALAFEGALPAPVRPGLVVAVALLVAARQGMTGASKVTGDGTRLGVALPYALAALFAVRHVAMGAAAPGPWDNDGAYYFGVARHIALTGRFEEPIVWNFLAPAAAVPHAPFDYWSGLLPVVLLGPLSVFGATYRVAAITMSILSGAGALGVAHLARLTTRRTSVRLAAVALFATSPWMCTTSFDTETAPLFHLVLVAALVAFAHGADLAAVVLAFLLVVTRTEGAILCAILWGLLLLRGGPRAGASTGAKLVAMAYLASAWLLVNRLVFGHVVPPAVTAVQAIASRDEMYTLFARPAVTWQALVGRRLEAAYVGERLSFLLGAVGKTRFLPLTELWLAFAATAGVTWRRRLDVAAAAWIALVAGAVGVAWWSPRAVFAPDRSLSMLLPLVVLVGAIGVDRCADALSRGASTRFQQAVASLAGAALLLPFVIAVTPYTTFPKRGDTDASLRRLAPKLGTDVVLTTAPWQVIAWTDARAVVIPGNGEAAIERAATRYGARWLLLPKQAPWIGASRAVLADIEQHRRARIGAFSVRVVEESDLLLFALDPSAVPAPP